MSREYAMMPANIDRAEKNRSDVGDLKRALGYDLREEDRTAFADMLARIEGSRFCLTVAQRDYLAGVLRRFEVETSKNLHSTGQAPTGRRVPAMDAFLSGPKPLRPPPGRPRGGP